MDNKKIGRYISEKRKSLGKTQKQIADELGVTYQAVSRWETGESLPDIETLCMLADFYNVDVEEILQRKKGRNHVEFSISDDIMWIMVMVSVFAYVLGFLTFRLVDAIWIREAALIGFVMFSIAGLFPTNIFLFATEYPNGVKPKKDIILYVLSYIPLIISTVLIIISY